MAAKALWLTALAAVLLGPGVALVAIATLLAPAAAGSSGCLYTDATTGTVAVHGSLPRTLTAVNADGQPVTLERRQLQRAAAIIAAGTSEQIPARGQLIALMAALTESGLRVLANTKVYPASARIPHDGDGGDHDSLGLFQMRPTTGWGNLAQLMDPVWSARAFYGGPAGPNHGSPRGLLDLPDWQALPPGAAAQAVEISAYPDRYAINQPLAATILATLSGLSPNIGATACEPSPTPPTDLPPGFAGALIKAAASQIGRPYVWGGGSFAGPTGGGFDCSGLVLYAVYAASRGRIRLPHYTGDQIHHGRPIAWGDRRPGDLLFFTYPGATAPHHVAISLGGDRILQAPRTGEDVRYGTTGEFAGQQMAVRRLE